MNTRTIGFLAIVVFLLTSCTSAKTPTLPNPTSGLLTPLSEPRVVEWARSYFDVHYCTDGDLPLKMTISLPVKPLRTPMPILVHLKLSSELIRPLVEHGFAVASVDWREPPNSKLPKGIEESKCAIRFLRASAAQFNIDPDQIGVFGCSRGAHIATMLGVTDAGANMEGDMGFEDVSSRVQAVVIFDGIADFKINYENAASELAQIHGITSFDDPLMAQLSPINYVTTDDPPFLMIVSKEEDYQKQARMLEGALITQGVPATYLQAEGANHCQYALSGPHTVENMAGIIGDFFEQTLK